MCTNVIFYISLARPIISNLGQRFTNEVADMSVAVKRKLIRTFSSNYDDVILEMENQDSESGTMKVNPNNTIGQKMSSQQQRPLPMPPDTDITTMPWFKNVDRRKGEELLKNGTDGYFLVRPSSKAENSLTLTLWFQNRVYNIPIRRRADRQFALGTPKTHEQCFSSIEAMINNYESEKLVLYSGGLKTGKTLLTSYPP